MDRKYKDFLIYVLSDPRTGEIRYVGKSSSNLQRPRHHSTPAKLAKDRSYKANWVRSLLRLGIRPVVEVVEDFDSFESLNEAERFWIFQFRALGFRLTNLTNGYEGSNKKKSAEHRAKIGLAHKGKVVSEETRDKQRRAAKLRTADYYTKIGAIRKDRGTSKHSEETKGRISTSMIKFRATTGR